MTRETLRNHQNTGNVLGSDMTNVSLGSDTPASRGAVPGVHTWSRELRRERTFPYCAEGKLAKMHSHDCIKIDFHDT